MLFFHFLVIKESWKNVSVFTKLLSSKYVFIDIKNTDNKNQY